MLMTKRLSSGNQASSVMKHVDRGGETGATIRGQCNPSDRDCLRLETIRLRQGAGLSGVSARRIPFDLLI